MRKTLIWCSALLLSICLVAACSQKVDEPKENLRNGVEKIKVLQDTFKSDLKTAILEMSENAKPLLSSVIFQDERMSEITKSSGLLTSQDLPDDDAIFDSLSDSDKAKIEKAVENYLQDAQNIAKTITVFDKGLPDGVEETDLSVKYAGVEYSKCVPETLEMAYQIRDEFYNPSKNLVKGAKLWITPRWHLIGAPLGAIFYSYNSDFSSKEKEAIRYAMDEWEKSTDGAVRFYEKPLNWWGKAKWAFGVLRNVRISKVNNKNYSGLTMPGNMPWSFMYLNTDELFENDLLNNHNFTDTSSWTHMVLIHELGHAICLQHEFERSDRDNYLEPIYNHFPGTCGSIRWWQKLFIKNYGTYDYKSCMNYVSQYYIKGTNRLVKFNDINKISHNDALTVKYIYSRISYNEMVNNWQDTKTLLLKEEY